ncbi:MAG: PAS domain S-box protein [Deltaproteobacteria bacterium]|nr:PAS domain S-box protein [Deltaproteobacteria bacterium]MBW2661519.1 PAS domain S-box protein [Deltaproteobacteria bacterium]
MKKSFITSQQHFQSLRRNFLTFVIAAFILTAAFFSTVAAWQEPLSIKVGAYANYPKIFMNANGRVSGFWPDLMEHMAQAENWEIEYVWGTWSDGLDRLKSEEIDIMPDVAFTEKRNKLYAFSEAPVLMSWTRMYVNKENAEIQSITDLRNKKIAALKGSVNLEGPGGLREIVRGFNLNCTFLKLDDYTEVFKAIEENRADAGITNRNFGNKNAKKFNLKKTPILFQPINIKFAFPKDAESTPYLSERVNYHIKQLKQDESSIYYRLLEEYFESEIAEKTIKVFPGWLSAVLKSIAVLFVFLILVIIATRIQVKRKTKEIRVKSEALQISEQRYREIYNSPSDAIFIHDASTGEILDVNRAMLEMYGYDREEVLQMKIGDISSGNHPYTQDQAGKLVNKAIVDGPQTFEWQAKKKNGKSFWAEVALKYSEIQDAGYVVAVVRDVTERKQAEETLQESERRLASAIEGNSIPTFIIDGNHFITHWNKACESLTGFSASETVGTKKQWLAFYHEERPVMADSVVDGATEEKMAECYKHIGYNKSALIEGAYEGENFYPDLGEKGKWLFFTAAPLKDQQGKIVGAIETFQDVTERRNMEEQIRQSQKMEAIGTLAAGIAHDFNNLLTVIIGNAQLALMDVIKNESLRKGIEEIEKAGDRAASLIRQLLAFSRKQIIKPEIMDLNKGINETEKMLKRMIGEDIEFLTVLEPELWKVYANSGQISQIIMNMVINAGDAMPQGGKLTIETANTDLNENYFRDHGIEGEKTGHYVMLAVSDTGSGMDKETQEHIFEPFFTTKEVGKGTGLGLSTAYGIVKQNNGFIWVYSEPGKGTIFKVYLPKVQGDAEPEEKEQPPVVELSGSETVLIVDDDEGLLQFAQKVLQGYGYKVLVAENGEDALMVSQSYEGPIDLMITDVVMPKMGGKELMERLQPIYPQMKVIYMSGYTDNAIVHHGVLTTGLNFLEKPFSPKSLALKVQEALGN